jgi:hypothetical protein
MLYSPQPTLIKELNNVIEVAGICRTICFLQVNKPISHDIRENYATKNPQNYAALALEY